MYLPNKIFLLHEYHAAADEAYRQLLEEDNDHLLALLEEHKKRNVSWFWMQPMAQILECPLK